MKQKASLTFSLPAAKWEALKRVAKQEGRSVPKLISDCIEFSKSFPPEFLDKMQAAADDLRIPLPVFIMNIVVKKVAMEWAYLQVFGHASPRAFTEFRIKDGRLLEADEFLEVLNRDYLAIFKEHKKAQEMRSRFEELLAQGKTELPTPESRPGHQREAEAIN